MGQKERKGKRERRKQDEGRKKKKKDGEDGKREGENMTKKYFHLPPQVKELILYQKSHAS